MVRQLASKLNANGIWIVFTIDFLKIFIVLSKLKRFLYFFFTIDNRSNIFKKYVYNFDLSIFELKRELIPTFLFGKKKWSYSFFRELKIHFIHSEREKRNLAFSSDHIYNVFKNQKDEFPYNSVMYKEIKFAVHSKQINFSEEIEYTYFPLWFNFILKDINKLNYVQSKIFSSCFGSDANLLISSPTGTGKTFLIIFCILRIFINSINFKKINWEANINLIKIIYIVPVKTVTKETVVYLEKIFKFLGLKTIELTGDSFVQKNDLEASNVIVGTPEKIDLFTRDEIYSNFFSQIRLLVIDEIHLLGDERGPILEQIILRFLKKPNIKIQDCRIVGISATLPNYQDVGHFIRANPFDSIYYFGQTYRKIPIDHILIAIKNNIRAFFPSNLLNNIILKKVQQIMHSNISNKIIIFVHSRKDTLKTGMFLLKKLRYSSVSFLNKTNFKVNHFINSASKINEKYVKYLTINGIGIHHAGLSRSDKTIVENLFVLNKISLLISTSTLAWGVNLPATHVIIKGTKVYSPKKSSWVEISNVNLIQMIGRVARIQSTSKNQGILITTDKDYIFYKKLFNQRIPIESRLIFVLPDSLNVECSRKNINSISTAKNWLSNTFLWIRFHRLILERKNSITKFIANNLISSFNELLLSQICCELNNAKMIKCNYKNKSISSTIFGSIASKFNLNYQTIIILIEKLSPNINQAELVQLFSFSSEFYNFYIRSEEKDELNGLAANSIFPIRENSRTSFFKANVLLQSYIGNLRIKNMSLAADLVYIGKIGGRYFRALFEIAVNKRWANLSSQSLNIYQFIRGRILPSQIISGLFITHPSVGKYFKILRNKGFNIKSIKNFSKEEVNMVLQSRKGSFYIKRALERTPFFDLSVNLQPVTRNIMKISLLIKQKINLEKIIKEKGVGLWLFIEDHLSDLIVSYQYLWLEKKKDKILISIVIPLFDNPFSPYFLLKLIMDNIIGSTDYIRVDLTKIKFPINYPILTETLNLKKTPNFRIFAGFRGGNIINEYFLSNFQIIQDSFVQLTGSVFKNQKNKMFFIPLKNSKEIYIELLLISFIFSKEKYNFVFLSIGHESISLKTFKLRKNYFASIGIPVERIIVDYPGCYEHILNNKSIFISSLAEWISIANILNKSIYCSKYIYISDFFHLVGRSNFGNIIESYWENFKVNFYNCPENRILFVSPFFSNSSSLVDWLDLAFFDLISQYQKNYVEKSNTFNRVKLYKINPKKIKKILNLSFNNKTIIKNGNFIKQKSLIFLSTKLKYLKTFIVQTNKVFFSKSLFEVERIQGHNLRLFPNIVGKTNIGKLFFAFKLGIIDEYKKYSDRRIIEEFFCGGHIDILFSSFGMLSTTPSDKISSSIGIIIEPHNMLLKANYRKLEYFPFVDRFCLMKWFMPLSYCDGDFFTTQEYVVESKWIFSSLENLLIYISRKKKNSIRKIVEYFISTFFFKRIKENPCYYGILNKTPLQIIVAIYLNPVISRLRIYGYINICDKNTIKLYREGGIIAYYFYKEKFFRISFTRKNDYSLLDCIIKSLVKAEELFFIKNMNISEHIYKEKVPFMEKIIQKTFTRIVLSRKMNDICIALSFSIRKIFAGWFSYLKNEFKFTVLFFLIELSKSIFSQTTKNDSNLFIHPEIDRKTSFLLAKVHNIHSIECFQNSNISFSKMINRFNISSINKIKNAYKTTYLRTLVLNFFINGLAKRLVYKYQWQKDFFSSLFSKFFFKKIIELNSKQNFVYILAGEICSNRLFFWKKFTITDNNSIYCDISIEKNTKILKIFVIDGIFRCLDKEIDVVIRK
nr:U5snrnp200 [Cryptomonas sp.]